MRVGTKYVSGFIDTLDGACGVGHASGFVVCKKQPPKRQSWLDYQGPPLDSERNNGGCGWLTAGFIDKEDSKMAYEVLTKQYGAPVFQTEVRKNTNSGNDFFFAMWDTQ